MELLEAWSGHAGLDVETVWPQERKVFPRFREIASLSERILEVGVGEGRMIRILRKAGVRAEFCSVDITHKVKLAPGHRILADARVLPFRDRVFDLVYSLGVVEHFRETGKAIQEHARVTKDRGYVLITSPHCSLHELYVRIRFLASNLLLHRRMRNFVAHVGRHLTIGQMRRYATSAGLDIVVVEGAPVVTPFSERIESLFQRILPPSRFGGYLYCLARK